MSLVSFRGHVSCRGALHLNQLALAPLLPDTAHFEFGFLYGVLRTQHALSSLSEHHVEHPFLVGLVDGRIGVARVADVGGPTQYIFQNLVLVRWFGFAVVADKLLKIRHRALKARKVVEFTVHKRLAEVPYIVDEKLFGAVNVLGELPD